MVGSLAVATDGLYRAAGQCFFAEIAFVVIFRLFENE